jgi:hypothetical protein
MNRICSCFAAISFAALAGTGAAIGAEPASTPVTVGQLIIDPDKYVDVDVVVRGHIEISDLWRAFESVHNLYESKAVVDQLRKDWKVISDGTKRLHGPKDKVDGRVSDAAQEMNELERKYCITVAPVRPFLRNGKYLTERTVIVRGRLMKLVGVELTSGCNGESHLMLQVDEVLDPPAPEAKSKR